MNKWEKSIFAVLAIFTVASIAVAVYLFIRRCKTKAIVYR